MTRPACSTPAPLRALQAGLILLIGVIPTLQAAPMGFHPLATPLQHATEQRVTSWQERKFDGIVKQQLDFSCGAAALTTILHHDYGLDIDEETIIRYIFAMVPMQVVAARGGFSLLDLKKIALASGAKASGYRLSLPELLAHDRPSIVPVTIRNFSHFVIFRGLHEGRILIDDPAFGHTSYTPAEFKKLWHSRIALVIDQPSAATRTAAPQTAQAPYVRQKVDFSIPQPYALHYGEYK